jgi:hypothetical protein
MSAEEYEKVRPRLKCTSFQLFIEQYYISLCAHVFFFRSTTPILLVFVHSWLHPHGPGAHSKNAIASSHTPDAVPLLLLISNPNPRHRWGPTPLLWRTGDGKLIKTLEPYGYKLINRFEPRRTIPWYPLRFPIRGNPRHTVVIVHHLSTPRDLSRIMNTEGP